MKIQRPKKGDFGYPPYERKMVIIRTVLYFMASAAVFGLGYFTTGKKENLLTIVAVLGLLPASKSLVLAIMYMRIPKFGERDFHGISENAGGVSVIYSMYLTSYKLNFPINCLAARGGNLIGYTEFQNCDTSACEEHIKDMLRQNSFKNITVKIFREKARFVERLAQLQDLDEGGQETGILELMCDISL